MSKFIHKIEQAGLQVIWQTANTDLGSKLYVCNCKMSAVIFSVKLKIRL